MSVVPPPVKSAGYMRRTLGPRLQPVQGRGDRGQGLVTTRFGPIDIRGDQIRARRVRWQPAGERGPDGRA